MTEAQLAKELGITQADVSMMEAGKRVLPDWLLKWLNSGGMYKK